MKLLSITEVNSVSAGSFDCKCMNEPYAFTVATVVECEDRCRGLGGVGYCHVQPGPQPGAHQGGNRLEVDWSRVWNAALTGKRS